MSRMKLPFPGRCCIDTSALIDLSMQYPVDVFPSLWADLESLKSNDRLTAPRQVFEELRRKSDALLEWARANKDMFAEVTEEQRGLVSGILSKFPELIDVKKETAEADPFVIALAISDSCAVVTSERPGTPSRPKIPDVCDHYEVECLSLVEFFRQEDWEY